MLLVQQITSKPLQKQTLVLDDGTSVVIELYYRPNQMGWYFNEISRNDFILRGVRVTNSPNILHQFKNQIPFGLGCFSIENKEPTSIEDFSSGTSKLYILTALEVLMYSEYLASG